MNAGDVVLVKFPFSDLESTKKRPALVLSRSDLTNSIKLVTLAMITSKIDGLKMPADYKIRDWQNANLLHPSLLRLSKIATVEVDLIDQELGRFSEKDILGAKKAFRTHLKFWL